MGEELSETSIPAWRRNRANTNGSAPVGRQYGETGLGLGICKRLAALMGGSIWAESVRGSGSTFHVLVRLPATVPSERDDLRTTPQPGTLLLKPFLLTSVRAATDSKTPLRILLAEYVEDNRDVVAWLLKEPPYQLDMAENSATAVEKSQLATYDLVLMDIQMPVMVVSADSYVEDIDWVLSDGANDYIVKSWAFMTMYLRLKRLLDQSTDNMVA